MYFETDLSQSLTFGLRGKGYPVLILERDGFDPATFVCSRRFVFTLDGIKYRNLYGLINDPPDLDNYDAQKKAAYVAERYSLLLHEFTYELRDWAQHHLKFDLSRFMG